MPYKNNIPQPSDSPATDSQADLLENFSQLDSQYGTAGDHVAFTAAADNGMHKKISLNGVIADPNLPDPQASLYLKTIAGNSELFFENFDVGGVTNLVRQMTNLPSTIVGGARGIITPWGLIMNFGSVIINVAATPVVFPIAYPNSALTLTLSIGNTSTASQQAVFSNLITTGFTGYGSTNGLLVYYFSIGN